MIKKKAALSKKDLINRINKGPYGPKSKEFLKKSIEYEALSNIYFLMYEFPPVISRGKNSTIWDVDGKEYIDLVSGFAVHNIGHCHPKVVEAIKRQSERLTAWCAMPNEFRLKLAMKLVELAPGKSKKKVHLLTTGSDGVEFAMRLARFYKSKSQILVFQGCYHGVTEGTLGATTHPVYRAHDPFLQTAGFVHVPYAYCYRCAFGKEYPGCGLQCTKYIEDLLKHQSGFDCPAAILAEPMLGAGGYIIPPKEFLSELRRITNKYDLLLIIDEVQTGWCRSGKMWACQYSDIEPDLMVVGKSMGGGLPISAVIGKEEIMDSMSPGGFMSTFGGTPLSCAASLAAIEVMEEEKLDVRAREMGSYFAKKISDLAEQHRLIGNINGRGLFIGIEIVRDKKTKEPGTKKAAVVATECQKRGLLCERGGLYDNILKVICPLTIEKEQIDKAISIFDKSFSVVES